MMQLRFTTQALGDVGYILSFLADLHESLPHRFQTALQAHLAEIKQHPERWSPKENGIRAGRLALSGRLRYYVFYDQPGEQQLRVLRIISQSADPTQWPT